MGDPERPLEATYRSEFGARVRALRRQKGLSIAEFQRVSGLHFSYVSAIERGVRNPTLNSVLLIAQGLEVDASELVRALPRPEPPRKRPYRPPAQR